jgi:hypothetical protein
MNFYDLLKEVKELQDACEPTVLVRFPLETIERLDVAAEELVNRTFDIRFRIRGAKRVWNSPWAREARDGARAAELLAELDKS